MVIGPIAKTVISSDDGEVVGTFAVVAARCVVVRLVVLPLAPLGDDPVVSGTHDRSPTRITGSVAVVIGHTRRPVVSETEAVARLMAYRLRNTEEARIEHEYRGVTAPIERIDVRKPTTSAPGPDVGGDDDSNTPLDVAGARLHETVDRGFLRCDVDLEWSEVLRDDVPYVSDTRDFGRFHESGFPSMLYGGETRVVP